MESNLITVNFITKILMPGCFFYFFIHAILISWRVLQASRNIKMPETLHSLVGASNGLPWKDKFYMLIPMVVGGLLGVFGLAYNKQIGSGKIALGESILFLYLNCFYSSFFKSPFKEIRKSDADVFIDPFRGSIFVSAVSTKSRIYFALSLIGLLCVLFSCMAATVLFIVF